MTVGGGVHYLLGISIFAPSIAIFTVGNQTGIQVALLLLLLCGIIRIVYGNLRTDRPLIYLLLFWGLVLGFSVWLQGFQSQQRNAMVVFGVDLSILFILGLIECSRFDFDERLQSGIIMGAAASAVYALYQQIALRVGWPFGIPPMNNPSYSLIVSTAEDVGLRSFGLFPEPSMLAAYLIPIGVSLLFVGSHKQLKESYKIYALTILIMLGTMASGSFSIVIGLPLVLLLCLMARRATLTTLTKLAGALFVLMLALAIASRTSTWASNVTEKLIDRLSGALEDPSLIVRYGMKVASLNIFLENPILGCGVVPSHQYFYSSMPSGSIGIQDEDSLSGGDSLPLYILAGQGIVGFFLFAGISILAYYRSRQKPFLSYTLLGCMVVMTLQAGNVDLYLIWIIMGLCLGQRYRVEVKSPMCQPTIGAYPSRLRWG